MSNIPHFLGLARGSPAPDVAVSLITFLLTVFVDLVVAINVGVILAALMLMRRMALAVNIELQIDSASPATAVALPREALPRGVVVYGIEGPLFFGAAEKLERARGDRQRFPQARRGHHFQ